MSRCSSWHVVCRTSQKTLLFSNKKSRLILDNNGLHYFSKTAMLRKKILSKTWCMFRVFIKLLSRFTPSMPSMPFSKEGHLTCGIILCYRISIGFTRGSMCSGLSFNDSHVLLRELSDKLLPRPCPAERCSVSFPLVSPWMLVDSSECCQGIQGPMFRCSSGL